MHTSTYRNLLAQTHKSAGFTLIEVLIAVVVLAIALGASLEALSGYTASQARLNERYLAQSIVWDVAIETYPRLLVDDGCGNLSDGYLDYWQWSQSVRLIDIPDDPEDELPFPFTPRNIVLTQVASEANSDSPITSLVTTCLQ